MSQQMSEAEMGRIALKIVKQLLSEKGLPAPNHFMRELGNEAKKLGETQQSLRAFYETLLPEIIAKMLNRGRVTLEISE